MIMSIQNLVSICLFVLKILNKNKILTSIKGRNSDANSRKTMNYYTNIDLVNDNVYTKFGLSRSNSIRFQDIEQNLILTSIKGRNSVQICRNLITSKLKCMSSLPAIMKKIQLKMKALECSEDFSHYMSIGIFTGAQGQRTLQSIVGSGQILNSSKTLWLSSLPAKMKKNRSKMKAQECSQHLTSIFQTHKGR